MSAFPRWLNRRHAAPAACYLGFAILFVALGLYGRISNPFDPTKRLKRDIEASLPVGSPPQNIEAFFASRSMLFEFNESDGLYSAWTQHRKATLFPQRDEWEKVEVRLKNGGLDRVTVWLVCTDS